MSFSRQRDDIMDKHSVIPYDFPVFVVKLSSIYFKDDRDVSHLVWLEENIENIWFYTRSRTMINEYAPISAKSFNGEDFPASKISHPEGVYVFFTNEDDRTKFLLARGGIED